jgi:hypothetical protein
VTIPGAGGQVPPRPDQTVLSYQPVPVSPGGTPIARVTEIVITPGSVLEGIFTYSTNPGAAGTLIASSNTAAAGVDQYGNNYLAGTASYQAGFAYAMNAGFVDFYSGSLAGGWTVQAGIEIDSGGDMLLFANGNIFANGTQIG